MFSFLTSSDSAFNRTIRRRLPWILVALTILLVVGVRFRLRDMPLERDEGEYAYAGQLILQGIPPYQLVYNMKLPGTYVAYAALMAVFGQTPAGIHGGLILVNVAAIILVFLLARKLLDEVAGAAAAIAYALMTLSPSVLGLQAHATHFVVVPALGGALILLGAAHSLRLGSLLASGLLFGLAFVMKQHGALFGVFGVFYFIWVALRLGPISRSHGHQHRRKISRAPHDWIKLLKAGGAFGLGLVIPYLFTFAVLWSAGVSGQFFFWTITYANKYITAVPLANASEQLRYAINVVTGPNLFFWLLAMLGTVVMWWEKRIERERVFVVALFICSFLSISIGFYFREHYFILLLPALSLLAGIAVSRGLYVVKHERTLELIPALIALLLFVLGFGSEMLTNSSCWFEYSPVKACRQIYGSALFPEAVEIAAYLRTNTPPQATIAVIGSEPEIYFYSRRHSATGYIYMYPLMEWHEYALKMQNEMIREIETAQPEYVIFVGMNQSWLLKESSHKKILDWWSEYQIANYDRVRTVDVKLENLEDEVSNLAKSENFFSNDPTQNSMVRKTDPKLAGSVFIFKRKSGLKT